jgi:hypothetical protein
MDARMTSRRGRAAALVAAGLVGGIVVAGYATANAQTSPTPSPGTTTPQDAPRGGPGGHHGGPGGGMGIHGEFVTKAADGGYQTMASQVGEVTAVSATSLTVKSEDGYSRTYVVNDDTLVNAGNEGTADVAKGDTVRVVAIVRNGTASALHVDDGTQVGRLRDKYAPAPPAAPDGTASGTAAT